MLRDSILRELPKFPTEYLDKTASEKPPGFALNGCQSPCRSDKACIYGTGDQSMIVWEFSSIPACSR